MIVWVLCSLLLMGCSNPAVLVNNLVFEKIEVQEELIQLHFNQKVTLDRLTFYPYLEGEVEGDQFLLTQPTEIGQYYEVEAVAQNEIGQTLWFKSHFYGYNPNPATLIFNELTPIHSAKYPERLEFYVQKEGNLGGVMLILGDPTNPSSRFIFPNHKVTKGNFITLVCRGEELGNNTFLWTEAKGLPNKEALLTLYQNENGLLVDAIAYYTDQPSIKLQTLLENQITDVKLIKANFTTATRSLSRQNNGEWIVTKTSGSTFGQPNNTEAYQPK